MKNRQIRLIIGILVGLILFASSIALLMYSKQNELKNYVEDHVEVYVSSKHLNKGDLIGPKDIQKVFLPKSYLAFTPLTQSEIMGRYASVEIFAKEPLRKEKLSIAKPSKDKFVVFKPVEKVKNAKKQHLDNYAKDTITVSLGVFKNMDYSLKSGDTIDIISIFPKKSKNQDFNMKYVALNVTIKSFISNAQETSRYISKGGKKLVKADSVIFEMQPKDLKNFLTVYYKTLTLYSNRIYAGGKGKSGNLWMVKCSSEADEKDQNLKKNMLVDHITQYRKRRAVERVSISYED